MTQTSRPRPEALLDLIAADGSRIQFYAYQAGPQHPAATVVRIWPSANAESFAEFVLDRTRERIVRDLFESILGRPEAPPEI